MPEKYKDEIEEILRKAGEVAPSDSSRATERSPEDRPVKPLVSRRAPAPDYRPSPRRVTVTPGKIMLAGVVLFLIGIKFSPFLWVGLAMLVGAYLLYFVTPRSLSYDKRWRGRPVEERRPSPWERFKRRRKNSTASLNTTLLGDQRTLRAEPVGLVI